MGALPSRGSQRAYSGLLFPIGIAAAYYAGCQLGFALRYPSSGISFFWPPNAFLLAAFLIVAPRRWPALLAGAFVAHGFAHAQDGIQLAAWSVQFLGNASQALLAAWIVRRFGRVDIDQDFRGALVFVVGACILAPAIASLLSASIYVSLGWATSFAAAWRGRTVSNAIATLAVVPALILLWRYVRDRPAVRAQHVAEFGALLLALIGMYAAARAVGRADLLGVSVALYAITPCLLWATVRFGGGGLSLALCVTILIISKTATSLSSAAGGTPADAIVGVQLLLAATAVPFTLLAGLLQQERSEEEALLETQHRYALAIGVGVIGIWDYHVATGACYVEGTLKASLGYAEHEVPDTLAGWESLIFEPDRDDVMARMSALITGAARTFEIEFRFKHKDGSVRWLHSSGAVSRRVGGRASRIVGTYTDVTERKESARALAEANDMAVRMERIAAVSEVTGSIAHELQQPLTAITSSVQDCLRRMDPQREPAVRDALTDVLRESQRASEIVERTRQLFANTRTQQIALNLNDVVREVLRVAMPRWRELGIRVEQDLAPDLPDVCADMVQMQQVLFNLLSNAADAMQGLDRKAPLRISTRRGKKHVVVSVRDSGKGLDHIDIARLFEPFYTTKAAGSGMGLAISRSIVRAHAGALWGVSNAGRGSTFRFKIPIQTGAGGALRNARKVLLVDDHAGLRRSLMRLMDGWGHHVAAAASGNRAIAIARSFRPDVAVVDMSLGDMTGLELARHLRGDTAHRNLFMIALTAHDDEDVRHACVAAGFDVFLVKQSQISQLEALLARMPIKQA